MTAEPFWFSLYQTLHVVVPTPCDHPEKKPRIGALHQFGWLCCTTIVQKNFVNRAFGRSDHAINEEQHLSLRGAG